MSVFEMPSTLELVRLALAEDLGRGDITSELLVPPATTGRAVVVAREELRVCGVGITRSLVQQAGFRLQTEILQQDASDVGAETPLLQLSGSLRDILALERTLLNFVQRLCGVATLTRDFVRKLPAEVKLLDTRKTTPGWRALEKYAVLVGGGLNHRANLGDLILVKNNHIDALCQAVPRSELEGLLSRSISRKPSWCLVEIEVRNMTELGAALSAGADIVMLDNMQPQQAREAIEYVRQNAPRVRIEVSGGIDLESIAQYAALRPDYISVGALTRAARSVDISLRLES